MKYLLTIILFMSVNVFASDTDENKICEIKGNSAIMIESELKRKRCEIGDAIIFTEPTAKGLAKVCDMSTITIAGGALCRYIGYVREGL